MTTGYARPGLQGWSLRSMDPSPQKSTDNQVHVLHAPQHVTIDERIFAISLSA